MCVTLVCETVGKMNIANVFSSISVICISDQICAVSEFFKT